VSHYNRGKEVEYGSGGEIHYYGRGIDEDSAAGSGPPRRKSGFFSILRSSPSLMIVIIDIIVIILVLIIVLPFVQRRSSVSNFEGYELSLHGFQYGDTATVSLVITSLPGEGYSEGESSRDITVLFGMKNEEDPQASSESVEVTAPEVGESSVARVELALPENGEKKIAWAEVRVEGETITLQKRLTE
jgi:hypothetical protein